MKLFSLLKNLNCRTLGNLNIEISGLYHHDKNVQANGLFFCINGTNDNGEKYISLAIKNGAVAVVVNHEVKNVSVPQIIVSDTRHAMAIIAANFYGNPARSLKIVGVSGTNGKTSITYILKSMFDSLKIRSALIGTNGILFDGNLIQTGMTTPDPIELHKTFFMLKQKGIKHVFMEISAHALDLKKLDGIMFDSMIFTNLTEDHLDYFGDMENYFKAKKKAFLPNQTKLSILNIDDQYGKRLFEGIKTKVLSYSTSSESDYFASEIEAKNFKQNFKVDGVEFSANLLGKFNVSNILAAVCYMKNLGYSLEKIAELVELISPVPGRFNSYDINGRTFIIDYAHTPDGLENVLKLCLELKNNDKKLICVFGCGGNRETQKRKIMGEISSKLADFSVITSDNPRFEAREKIANDIVSGIKTSNYKVILDRSEAICYAHMISSLGDIVLVAGKGEEDYIDELGKKSPYSDKIEVLKLREK